jgi:hypothetical protein
MKNPQVNVYEFIAPSLVTSVNPIAGFEPEIYANWVRKEELERWV